MNKKYNEAINILKLVNINNTTQTERTAIYYHLLMNYTKLKECDSAYHYYSLINEYVTDKMILKNIEAFKKQEFDKECPQ